MSKTKDKEPAQLRPQEPRVFTEEERLIRDLAARNGWTRAYAAQWLQEERKRADAKEKRGQS